MPSYEPDENGWISVIARLPSELNTVTVKTVEGHEYEGHNLVNGVWCGPTKTSGDVTDMVEFWRPE